LRFFFSENLDIESFLDLIYKVDKFFDIAYVSMGKQDKFVTCKFKEGAAAWWGSITNHKETSRQITCNDVEAHKTTTL